MNSSLCLDLHHCSFNFYHVCVFVCVRMHVCECMCVCVCVCECWGVCSNKSTYTCLHVEGQFLPKLGAGVHNFSYTDWSGSSVPAVSASSELGLQVGLFLSVTRFDSDL